MKALYAYFGELGIFDLDIPGHSFYQVGLLRSIADEFGIERFDFYNYLDEDEDRIDKTNDLPKFGNTKVGHLLRDFSEELIREYRISYSAVFHGIAHKEYDKLFLKARFRNLSTLSKKMKDAYRFETIIQYALSNGYDTKDIIIVDTDLSLPEGFVNRMKDLGLGYIVPSINWSGTSGKLLHAAIDLNSEYILSGEKQKNRTIMYHGNLDFENYKEGHSKNPIIFDVIKGVDSAFMFDQSTFNMTLGAKDTPALRGWLKKQNRIKLMPRQYRELIFNTLIGSFASVNVSKDRYIETGFVPARVYESVLAGTIPISYKQVYGVEAMTFETVEDFFEICKFLVECSPADYLKILRRVADSLDS